MNVAALLLCHSGRRASVSGLLRHRLHWLPVPERVEYKICLLVLKALHGMAPNYLSELCRPNAEDTARSRLRSAARGDLQVPHSKTNFGSHALAVAGPMFWNRLPPEIRANDSLQSFKSQLKTYYSVSQKKHPGHF